MERPEYACPERNLRFLQPESMIFRFININKNIKSKIKKIEIPEQKI